MVNFSDSKGSEMNQARKRSTKINFLGPETAGWGWGLPREGMGVQKFVPSLESLFSFSSGVEGGSSMSPKFCWDVPGVPKVSAKE